MPSKWEEDLEFSRAEWDGFARYVAKGCEQRLDFSSDQGLPGHESFAQVLEATMLS
jgi:hypothetical protein